LYEVTTDPQEAVDRLLRSLKAKGAGEMLSDADWEQLRGTGGDLHSVDVLLDVAQLGELLRELFVYYRPGARKVYRTQSQRAKTELPASISGKMVSGKMELLASISGKMQSPAGVSGKMQLPSRRAAPTPSPKRSQLSPTLRAPPPPLPPALGVEERDEMLQELFLWSRDNSLLFLQARYRPRIPVPLLLSHWGRRMERRGQKSTL
jgi:hypothetical protein